MKKQPKNKLVVIGIVVLAALILLLGGGFFYYSSNTSAISSKSETITFEVVSGDSIDSITKRLEEQKIIKSAFATKLNAKLNGLQDIKAGSFSLDKSWDSKKILQVLTDAKEAKGNEVTITFREGIWAKDIAVELEKQLGIPATQFIELWNDDAYLKELIAQYDFLSEELLNDQVRVKLEGYLFPETYSFAKDATTKEITKTFLDHFESVYTKYKDDIAKSGKSLHDIITLASIVQYEASTPEDMKLVAGVFYNRMNVDMNLGSSVTVCYAMYEDLTGPDDCEVNTNIDSPYNTYIHKGLPIGPIENPGETAINAVLHPTDSEYLYFVADIYGDGKVHYSKTLKEQEANIDKYNLRK